MSYSGSSPSQLGISRSQGSPGLRDRVNPGCEGLLSLSCPFWGHRAPWPGLFADALLAHQLFDAFDALVVSCGCRSRLVETVFVLLVFVVLVDA